MLAVVVGGSAAWFASQQGGQATRRASGRSPPVTPIAAPVKRAPLPEPADLAWGPSVVDYASALATASDLPLDVAAGQVIVATVSGPDPATAASLVSAQHLAGVILMGGAITDASQVRALAAAVQAAAAEDGRSWPAIVSTDQEGGPVARLSGIVPGLPAFMAAGSIPDKATVTTTYEAAARDMRALGVNVDWAPDADVTVGAGRPGHPGPLRGLGSRARGGHRGRRGEGLRRGWSRPRDQALSWPRLGDDRLARGGARSDGDRGPAREHRPGALRSSHRRRRARRDDGAHRGGRVGRAAGIGEPPGLRVLAEVARVHRGRCHRRPQYGGHYRVLRAG